VNLLSLNRANEDLFCNSEFGGQARKVEK